MRLIAALLCPPIQTGRGRWIAIGALAGLTLIGERTSLGRLIERTPGLRELDALGRQP